jgi:isopenicillin N synthase-like dioxygenase
MDFAHGIPKIDISILNKQNSIEDLRELAKDLYKVYTEVGFSYITNHSISQDLIDAVFEQSRLFHALPEQEKMKIVQNEFFRGYMPLSGSKFKVSTLETAKRPNQSAAFILAHEVDESDPDYQLGINLAGPNQWPSEELLPNFKSTLMQYRHELSNLALKMVRLFALALDQDLYAFDKYFMNPTTFLRLQYYIPQPEVIPEHQYGIAPHTDYGFLTLLVQDSVGGLQVLDQAGSWINVSPLKGGIILNTGDMLRYFSNNTIISTPHRVINISGRERFSVPFFFEPNMHAQISPIVKTNGIHNNREPIEYADYLMERIKNNYNIGAKDKYDLLFRQVAT